MIFFYLEYAQGDASTCFGAESKGHSNRKNKTKKDKLFKEKISLSKLNLPDDVTKDGINIKEKIKPYLDDMLGSDLKDFNEHLLKEVCLISCKIKSFKRSIGNETDVNNGRLYVYIWNEKNTKIIKSYCIIIPKLSGVWIKIAKEKIRDFRFPFQFAQTFLEEREMNAIKVSYLTGRSSSSSTLRVAPRYFDPQEIMWRYGVIKEFKSCLKDSLLKTFGVENYIEIQKGQIKLRIKSKNRDFEPEEFVSMIKIIDEKLSTPSDSWKILNYISIVRDFKLCKQLDYNVLKELANYMIQPDKHYSFNPNSLLEHPHESFYESKKKLILNGKTIRTFPENCNITIKTIAHEVKKNLKERKDYRSAISQLSLKYHDYFDYKEKTEKVVKLIRDMQILQIGNGKNAYFQHNKCWHQMEQETFLETNVRFVNIVKKCLLKKEKNPPKILPWSCSFDSKATSSTFNIEDIYDFVKMNDLQDESEKTICKGIAKVLGNEYALFKDDPAVNDFASSSSRCSFIKNHSKELLDMNLSILENSSLGKCFKSKSIENTSSLQKFSKFLVDSSDMDTLTLKLKEIKEYEEAIGKIRKELVRKESCISIENGNNYRVNYPYLTNSLLSKLEELNVCPIRLLQFLRMHFKHLNEGEYNELYHLSNCICIKENQWKYVVGDRIFSVGNNNVELFDVMALNTFENKAYLVHVKKGFGASASRELSSQVGVCGEEIWKSLSVNSETNMLKKFYQVAVKADASTHRQLTKREIEAIGKNENEFLDVMKSHQMKYYICFSPCTSKTRKFWFLRKADLDYNFQEHNVLEMGIIKKLHEVKILNDGKVTSNFFKSQKQLQTEHGFLKNDIYSKLVDKIGGTDVRKFLSDSSSFVAKVTLIDLYRKFSSFIFNEKQFVKLKILEITSFEPKRKQSLITDHFKSST